MRLSLNIFVLIIFTLCFGCMEDINVSKNALYHNAADLITEVETSTSFTATSPDSVVKPARLIVNDPAVKFYLDLRSKEDFTKGHIAGAINVSLENIIDTLHVLGYTGLEKIILVSATGQKAAYAASLLRLYGFDDVLSLDFGMAQWHMDFSQPLINGRNDSQYWSYFNTKVYSKPAVKNSVPNVEFDDPSLSTFELLKAVVKKYLTEQEFLKSIITTQELDQAYLRFLKTYKDKFIICYSDPVLYTFTKTWKNIEPPITRGGHPISAVLYNPGTDFKAHTNLLSLPLDKEIVVYCYNGQRSAYITAYLRMLGYSARFIHFGAISMFYNRLDYFRVNKSFREEDVFNYPYVF